MTPPAWLLAPLLAAPLLAAPLLLAAPATAATCSTPTVLPSASPTPAGTPAPTGPPTASPSPSPTATPPGCDIGVELGPQDDGQVVDVPVGQPLHLTLPGSWQPPQQDATLYRRTLQLGGRLLAGWEVPTAATSTVTAISSDGSRSFRTTVRAVQTGVHDAEPDTCPSPYRYAPPYGTTLLTERDSGQVVQVRQGDPVVVRLQTGSCGAREWRLPTTPAGLVLQAGSEDPGGVLAQYRPVTLGTVELSTADDARCLHAAPSCAVPSQAWRVVLHVVPKPPCDPVALLSGPATAPAGATVTVGGAAYGPVQLAFLRGGRFTVRHTAATVRGRWSVTFPARQDERYEALSQGCRSRDQVTRVLPVASAPPVVRPGSTVTVTVLGQPGAPVQLLMRSAHAASFSVRRSGRLSAAGRWTTAYVATTDERYYARSGAGRTGPVGLTRLG